MMTAQPTPRPPSRAMRLAQIVWLVFVSITLVLYAAGTLIYHDQLRQICTAPVEQCREFDLPTPLGAQQLATAGLSLDAYASLVVGFRVVLGILPLTLGLLIFARKRNEPMALFVSLFLVMSSQAGGPTGVMGQVFPVFALFFKLVEFVSTAMLPLFFGLFPNGRMVPRIYWGVVIFFSGTYFINGTLGIGDPQSDPVWTVLAYVGWLSVLVGGTAAQVYRYLRVSTSEEKRQTRWVLFGFGLLVVWIVTALALTALSGDPTIGTSRDPDLVRRVSFLIYLNFGFEFIYLSIGMAILRSRLFDIDIIIRRTLVYSIITALLALFYFGTVILLQQLFHAITGAGDDLAIIISTLALYVLFNPLRRRVQNAIDSRFFRRKYDAQKVIERFAVTVRDEVELEKLTGELLNVVNETMQPTSVSLWLKQTENRRRTTKEGS